VPLLNWAREAVGTAVLPGPVFNAKVRQRQPDLLEAVKISAGLSGTESPTVPTSESAGSGYLLHNYLQQVEVQINMCYKKI